MKLILGGGGDEVISLPSHKFFYNCLGESKKILYIPVAILSDKYTPEGCLAWFSNAFKDIGTVDIDTVTSLTFYDNNSLNMYDGIYIGGGNTFKLLKEIKESNFSNLLDDYMKTSGVIYGGSAGAIIFGRDISNPIYADTNNVGLEELAGINALKGYDVWCHYKITDDINIDKLLKKKRKIISIGEDSAVYYEGSVSIYGIGNNIHIHTQDRKIDLTDGQSLNL